MNILFILGTAGSGKSALTATLLNYYLQREVHAVAVNLDPGAIYIPYSPEVDARDYIDFNEIMSKYNLGPNGALIFASDLLAANLGVIQEALDEINPDLAIIDTPGQTELFVYRTSGPYLVQNLMCENKGALFLFDHTVSSSPLHMLSIILLYYSIYLRLRIPMLSVLTKIDIGGAEAEAVLKWTSKPFLLEEAIKKEKDAEVYAIASGLMRALKSANLMITPIPVSNVTWEGVINVASEISKMVARGEEVGYS